MTPGPAGAGAGADQPPPPAADHQPPPAAEVAVGRAEQFPVGAVRLVLAAGRRLAVGNLGGRLFALDDACLHRGGSLACGHLDGPVLACPMHWWRYDVRTGERLGQPALRLRRYPVRVAGGEVLVAVPPAPARRSWREILLEHARAGKHPGRSFRAGIHRVLMEPSVESDVHVGLHAADTG